MRVRMLDRPEVIETINGETVPLMWTVTGRGLPDLPAFRFWQRSYDTNPWPHIAFAVFFVVDPDGRRTFGASGCGFLAPGGALADGAENLREQLERYRKARALEARGPEAADALAAHLADVDEAASELIHCFRDPRLQTFRSLLGRRTAKWPDLLEALRPRAEGEPEIVEPGLREAMIHALASFLFDDTPFHEHARPHLLRLYESLAPADRREWRQLVEARVAAARDTENRTPDDPGESEESNADRRLRDTRTEVVPLPPSIRHVAARSLVVIAGLDLAPEDPVLIEKLRAWWREHHADERYRIPW